MKVMSFCIPSRWLVLLLFIHSVSIAAIANSNAPTITLSTDRSSFSVNVGTWTSGGSPLTYAYQWQQSDNGSNASPTNLISIGTNQSLILNQSMIGKYIRCQVTASDANNDTPVSIPSAFSNQISAIPYNSTAPAITGTGVSGHSLSCGTGSWTDLQGLTLSYTYAWQRSASSDGSSPTAITNATSSTYNPSVDYIDKYVACQVTATDNQSTPVSTTATTLWMKITADHAPVNQVQPIITGTPQVGTVLTATTHASDWTDAENDILTFTYAWSWSANADGSSANSLSVTTATYSPVSSDAGHYLSCTITADDQSGQTTSKSTVWIGPIAQPPTIGSLPSITGNKTAGSTLTQPHGTWTSAYSSSLNFSYQWKRATNSQGSGASSIGINSATYTTGISDVTYFFACTVTADDGHGGIGSATSAWYGPITPAPINTASPNFTGTGVNGHPLTINSNGTWVDQQGLILTYTYAWRTSASSDGSGSTAISGATSATYTPVSGDVGNYLACQVTATDNQNPTVSTIATTTWMKITTDHAPVNQVQPIITGTSQVGTVITATTHAGDWTDAENDTLIFTYAWSWSANADGSSPTVVNAATNATYTPVSGDAGHYLSCTVTANDQAGQTTTKSTAWIGPITYPPTNTQAPTVAAIPNTATLQTGVTLGVSGDTWNGQYASSITKTYQWQRSAASSGSSPTAITGATKSTYVTTAADTNQYLSCTVSVDDTHGGTASVTSNWLGKIIAPPPGIPSFTRGADFSTRAASGLRVVSGWATNTAANGATGTLAFTCTTSDNTKFRVLPVINASSGDLFFAVASGLATQTQVTITVTLNAGTVASGPSTFVMTLQTGTDTASSASFTPLTAIIAGGVSSGTASALIVNGVAGTAPSGTTWSTTATVNDATPTVLSIKALSSNANPDTITVTIDSEPASAAGVAQ